MISLHSEYWPSKLQLQLRMLHWYSRSDYSRRCYAGVQARPQRSSGLLLGVFAWKLWLVLRRARPNSRRRLHSFWLSWTNRALYSPGPNVKAHKVSFIAGLFLVCSLFIRLHFFAGWAKTDFRFAFALVLPVSAKHIVYFCFDQMRFNSWLREHQKVYQKDEEKRSNKIRERNKNKTTNLRILLFVGLIRRCRSSSSEHY